MSDLILVEVAQMTSLLSRAFDIIFNARWVWLILVDVSMETVRLFTVLYAALLRNLFRGRLSYSAVLDKINATSFSNYEDGSRSLHWTRRKFESVSEGVKPICVGIFSLFVFSAYFVTSVFILWMIICDE